jgi:hypothetical protein
MCIHATLSQAASHLWFQRVSASRLTPPGRGQWSIKPLVISAFDEEDQTSGENKVHPRETEGVATAPIISP